MLDKTDVNRSLKLVLTKTLNPELCPDSPYMGLNTDQATGRERLVQCTFWAVSSLCH